MNRLNDAKTGQRSEQHSGLTAFDRITRSFDTLPSGSLQVISGERIGRIVLLNRAMTRLGFPGDTCAMVVNRGREGYFLSHLEGEIKPRVNGTAVGDRAVQLSEGAIVEIGDIRMKFHQGKAPAADNLG